MKYINKNNTQIPTQDNKQIIVTAILTEDERGQYAVYIGIGDNDFIMSRGRKLNYREALKEFPLLEKKNYRQ